MSPFIIIYKRNGDTFTKLPNPNMLPPGNSIGLSFSPDNNYLAVSHNVSPFITIYIKKMVIYLLNYLIRIFYP